MKFTLTLECDNAAFHGAGCPDAEHACAGQALQTAQILRSLIEHLDAYGFSLGGDPLKDSNGNRVGEWLAGS